MLSAEIRTHLLDDGSLTRPKCQCDYCQKWHPLYYRIKASLNEADQRLLEDFFLHEWDLSDAVGMAEAKLAGDWPGWEWMKGYVGERVFAFEDGDGI